ncbi:MAG: DUF1349 domain-containing protein [Ruminococcus sp.]|nr:DUF1349 domain-containing protein [Ruminococcus sp.]
MVFGVGIADSVVDILNSFHRIKASVKFENERFQLLGSVVTNHGYSDRATTAIQADNKKMWYRLSHREDDFCIEFLQTGYN